MKKIFIITATLLMTLSMSAQTNQDSSTLLGKDGGRLFIHPWAGKRVAYLGDSITDPKVKAAKKKYWEWLEEWLGITPWEIGRAHV